LGGLIRQLQAVPRETVATTFVLALGASLLLPFLGAVGLYDPWESHYAEVAREMVARDDYVHPHWKEHYFFSKPVLLFWLSAVGFKLLDVTVGGITGPGPMPELTELAARLPVALIALFCLYCVYRVVSRFFGLTAGVLSALTLITMPFFVLVGKQHITDMPFVGLSAAGICLMMESFFGDEEDTHKPIGRGFVAVLLAVTLPQYLQIARGTQLLQGHPAPVRWAVFGGTVVLMAAVSMWLLKNGKDSRAHLFYVLCGLATLAKGLPGILLPGMVFLAYVGLTWEWWRLKRIRAVTGGVLFLLVAAPWFVVLTLFTGKDDESKTFLQRFWIHDHLNRITGGVHGERGTFEYYIKQLGWGTMPWTGLLPFAWLDVATPRAELKDTIAQRVRTFIAIWALSTFALFSFSTTKFHHYILPMVIPLSMAVGIMLADFWESRRMPAMLVIVATIMGAALIGQDLARNPWNMVDLFTYHYVSYKPDYYMPTDFPWGAAFGVLTGLVAVIMGVGALLAYAPDVRRTLGEKAKGAVEPLRWLAAEVVEALLWLGETLMGLVVKPGRAVGARSFVVAVCLAGLCTGYFASQVYFLKLAPHWSQRWLFNTYHAMKQGDEPIIAYLMNWRGESFYSKASEPQINDGNQLRTRCKQPGREFILVETTRYKGLESSLGPEFKGKVNIVDRSNAKWYLVAVDD